MLILHLILHLIHLLDVNIKSISPESSLNLEIQKEKTLFLMLNNLTQSDNHKDQKSQYD